MEFGSVPGRRVSESDCFGFDWSQLVETKGKCVVVIGHKVRGDVKCQGRGGGHFGGKIG